MGKTHSRYGRDHTNDFYGGSPTDMNVMSQWLATEPPENFVKVVIQNFEVPTNYARWGSKRKRAWLDQNLGQAERELIAHIRKRYGDFNKDVSGVLTNVGSGGITSGFNNEAGIHLSKTDEARERQSLRWRGESNPMKRPEVRALFKGELNPAKRPEVRAKISRSLRDNPKRHRPPKGSENPNSRPVINLTTGEVYGGIAEAARKTGLTKSVISQQATKVAAQVCYGERVTPSLNKTCRGKPNLNYGNCWMGYNEFIASLNSGKSVEVHHPVTL